MSRVTRFRVLGKAGIPPPIATIHPRQRTARVGEVDAFEVLHRLRVEDLHAALHRHFGVIRVRTPKFAVQHDSSVQVLDAARGIFPACDTLAAVFVI
mgnify:CR=1 FL=1